MAKRKTRATNMEKGDDDVHQIDLPKKNRFRGKNKDVNKVLFDEQGAANASVDEPSFTTLKPVPLDQHTNVNDGENSPPPLIIDIDKETCSTQSIMSNYFPRTEPIGERLPRCTSNATNKTQKHLSNNSTYFTSIENRCVGVDRLNNERLPEGNLTPVINRSTDDQRTSNSYSQASTSRIVASVDRRRRDSNEDLNHHHRTSTPIRPSRQHQINIGLAGDYSDSFSVDSIPQETFNMLSKFPEFRRLVKAYQNEKKKCDTWEKDFTRLQNNYSQLEANSFPRPPPVALSYLVDLVTQIQQSGGRGDPRTDEQLARDLGEKLIVLMGLKDVTPQQTALNIFNHFYPGYETKINLGLINNLDIDKPGFLETMLVFAQRSAPGTNYKMQELRDALSNSIRGARYHWRKINGFVSGATPVLERINVNHIDIQDENRLNQINGYATGTVNMNTNATETERRFDADECL